MPKRPDDVFLRVDVSPDFKARLKGYSARMGLTMGELLESLADEPLKQLEEELLAKTNTKKTSH